MIGATTDPGRLPEAFLSRFPLRPRLVDYTEDDMILMSARNALAVNLKIVRSAARLFAGASRYTPREMNNLAQTLNSLAHMMETAVGEARPRMEAWRKQRAEQALVELTDGAQDGDHDDERHRDEVVVRADARQAVRRDPALQRRRPQHLEELDADTRFQAGLEASRRGWL